MTKPKLLANLPIENLTKEYDYLGVIDKGDLIKAFLVGNKEQLNEIKMFTLYGEWGSGKSSLMKYLEKELKSDFNTFFFEAWEFEKDTNLAMSLLQFINTKNIETGEQFCDDLIKYGSRILRGLGKSVKLNIYNIELDPSSFVEELTKKEELSFYEALNAFKLEFVRFEDKITLNNKPKFNIVFIDDLDRCEPEQVLNLLSSIKLFFTYGQKTIFFCGIDKKAVNQAVKTKYGKVVKSNEYLEKIFDISFSMPEYDNLLNLINHYFDDTIYKFGVNTYGINVRINEFFRELEFTNPRRVKKVLNKFQYLRNLKEIDLQMKFMPFPNIDMKDGVQQSFFETTLILYLIILHEFYEDYYRDFLDFEKKKNIYLNLITTDTEKKNVINLIERNFSCLNFEDYPEKIKHLKHKQVDFMNVFLICFGPTETKNVSFNHFNENSIFLFDKKNKIEHLYYKFLSTKSQQILLEDKNLSKCNLKRLKKLIKNAL
ncbi:MAG: KAP family NTPase [Flavobacterium sp.]|uniref:KAP family P-loop NTPase fold protein n=1 Tax=Flavobacterium sp. TaxID=239 RepID=UPI0025BED9CE|nr:P-loop NTPase fold protein [Flavobacterium sp.]MCA1966327.1 KAP family NTPase [Flavobacterium sp.]